MTLDRRRLLFLVGGSVAASMSRVAVAQAYPTRPVRVIVPFAPGGPTDVIARIIAQKMSEHVGKQFYVENVAGAGGNVGMGRAAKAPPDGYTLVVVPPNYAVNPTLYDTVPYDPEKDFSPVTLAVTTTVVLTVHPSIPARTVNDLAAAIKASPGKYNYSSGGIGTPGHLVGELFRLALGLDLVHVPYNSAGLAIGATVAGHTLISFTAPAPVVPHVREGMLRPLAVTSKKRSQAMPDVPTMVEAGYPQIEFDNWMAVLAPGGTPHEIITLLSREIAKIMAVTDIKERMAVLGYEPVASTPEECAERLKLQRVQLGKLVRDANIKIK